MSRSSTPPGRHAGNIDNKELVAGTTLYVPVFVRGALFEIGDGHAAQSRLGRNFGVVEVMQFLDLTGLCESEGHQDRQKQNRQKKSTDYGHTSHVVFHKE